MSVLHAVLQPAAANNIYTAKNGYAKLKPMEIRVLYRPISEHATKTEEYFREFQRRSPQNVKMVNLDTRAGADEAALYGLISYPAILVINNAGELVKSWEGEDFPLMDEIASYANS